MKTIYIVTILIFAAVLINAQKITRLVVTSGGTTKNIPVYDREGTLYFSINSFAEALAIKFEYDSVANRIKLDFKDYALYITAKDPFLIISKRDEKSVEIFQLPTSTYLLGDHIYVPLIYCLDLLNKVSGTNMVFSEPDKLTVKNENYEQGTGETNESKSTNISAFDISGINIEEKANGSLVRVISKKRIYSYNSTFKNGIFTIIFRNVHADAVKIDRTNLTGLVKWISTKNTNTDTEIKFGVGKDYTAGEVLNADKSNDLLIVLYNKAFEKNPVKSKVKNKWDFNVIVIDPGHGGKDTGTLGVDGIEEKDINLAVALRLGKEIQQQMNDVKVVYTRKTDKFIELYRRGQIANEEGGNLFISIHCNATPKKPSNANGSEVYLLRPGRTKEAISIAERENSVIKYEDNPSRYQKLTDENFILVSMAQSSYMRYSEKFADLLNTEFGNDSGIEPRGVKQAGFYVLVGASMPSVLVETGFLSNRHDAIYLNSAKGQIQIADAIFKAIKKFKDLYQQNILTE